MLLMLTPAAWAAQGLPKVTSSQPHTSFSSMVQTGGVAVHLPSAAAPHCPVGRSQKRPAPQSSSVAQALVAPGTAGAATPGPPAPSVPAHSPSLWTLAPASAALQSFAYVVPSHPHTGW